MTLNILLILKYIYCLIIQKAINTLLELTSLESNQFCIHPLRIDNLYQLNFYVKRNQKIE